MSFEATRVTPLSDVTRFIPSERWKQLSTDMIDMQTVHQRRRPIGGNSPLQHAYKSMSTELPTTAQLNRKEEGMI